MYDIYSYTIFVLNIMHIIWGSLCAYCRHLCPACEGKCGPWGLPRPGHCRHPFWIRSTLLGVLCAPQKAVRVFFRWKTLPVRGIRHAIFCFEYLSSESAEHDLTNENCEKSLFFVLFRASPSKTRIILERCSKNRTQATFIEFCNVYGPVEMGFFSSVGCIFFLGAAKFRSGLRAIMVFAGGDIPRGVLQMMDRMHFHRVLHCLLPARMCCLSSMRHTIWSFCATSRIIISFLLILASGGVGLIFFTRWGQIAPPGLDAVLLAASGLDSAGFWLSGGFSAEFCGGFWAGFWPLWRVLV